MFRCCIHACISKSTFVSSVTNLYLPILIVNKSFFGDYFLHHYRFDILFNLIAFAYYAIKIIFSIVSICNGFSVPIILPMPNCPVELLPHDQTSPFDLVIALLKSDSN